MHLFKPKKQDTPKRRQFERQATIEVEDAATFRRGRTLTGSVSSSIRVANEGQADLKSSRVHAHELVKKRRRIASAFILVAIVAAGLYFLINQFTAQPIVRASPDPSLQISGVYEEAIDNYLSDHPSERLRFLTNEQRLTEYLQLVTPEVKSVAAKGAVGFGASLFEVQFREPIASWSLGKDELYVDEDGVPFSENYFAVPTLRISDQSGVLSTAPGQSVMSNRFMSYVGQLIALSKEYGYGVTTITIPVGMTRQVEVRIDGIVYPFKFSSDRSAGEGVEDMVKAIEWLKARQLTPEYVDVRVPGKVFYK